MVGASGTDPETHRYRYERVSTCGTPSKSWRPVPAGIPLMSEGAVGKPNYH